MLKPASGRTFLASLLLGVALIGAQPALADVQQAKLTISANQYGITQRISLQLDKSMVVDLPADVSDVVVSQPGVAGAVMRTSRRAIIQGVSGGDSNIIFLDANGRTISVLDIKVIKERSQVGNALQDALARVIPGSNISVESVTLDGNVNRVVLSGTVLSGEDKDNATQVAIQFAGSPENVANIVTVAGPQQVMLKVTIAEVSRETVKQLGINLGATFGSGGMTTSLISAPAMGGASNVVATSGIGATISAGNFSLSASLKALERRGAMRTLAEPTLTAMSGQKADFLVGGDFPVPTDVDKDGKVTYTFKQFGVGLGFTPTVKSNGGVNLVVETSVSEPSSEGSFSAGTITIPGTKERKASTTVELGAGTTLAIGGLMQDQVRQQINQMPGLANIPILGALFRSRDFVHSQTELLILVTPYLVQPSQTIALPTDDAVPASDAEAVFLGKLEAQYGVGNSAGMRGSIKGSIGFVLD